MALNSTIRRALARLFTWLDHRLMTLVAGEDLRVHQVIARTVMQTRAAHGFDLETRWGKRPDLAANPRVE
jgi:hypothetical protein